MTFEGGLLFTWQQPAEAQGPLDGYILEIGSPRETGSQTMERILPGEATSFLYFPAEEQNEYELLTFFVGDVFQPSQLSGNSTEL